MAVSCAALASGAQAGDPPLFPLPSYGPGFSESEITCGDVNGDGLADIVSPTSGALRIALGRPDGTFAPFASQTAPDAKLLIDLGDVDGDGDLDAITDITQFGQESVGVQVLLNDGDGAFTSVFTAFIGALGNYWLVLDAVAVADLDGDGMDDIAVTRVVAPQAATVSVLLATGGGGFAAPVVYPLAGACRIVAHGDLDLDGDVDLALPGSGAIHQLRNAGDGSFVLGPVAPTSFSPLLCFQLVDATGDGRLDAVHLVEASGLLAVLPGQPDGSFGVEVDVALPFVAERSRLADLDAVPGIDLALAGYPMGIAILRGLGGLTFEEQQRVPLIVSWLDALDANLDGRPDLLALGDYATVVLALEGGGFDSTLQFPVDEELRDVALADVDGDGRLDLLEAHASPNVVQVRLQQPEGSFALVQTLPALSGAVLHPCHADGDAHVDLVVSSSTSTAVVVALGVGDGTLSAFSPPIQAGRDVLLADVNGDGHDDLVGWAQSLGPEPYELRVTYGTGLGTFPGTAPYGSPVPMGQLAAADIDQDGRIDILVGNGSVASSPILKWVNTGFGLQLKSFNPPLLAPSVDLRCGDFDGDGDPDLLTLPGMICLGAPAGQFAAPTYLSSLAGSGPIRVADLDVDGFDDALVTTVTTSTLLVTRGGPSGLTSAFEAYGGVGHGAAGLAIGDIDADGQLDVATGSHEDFVPEVAEDFVTILLRPAPGPFADLGFALAGSEGEPALTGIGTLAAGTPLSLRVTGALPFAPARLIVGAQLLQLPFKGGVLVPSPALVLLPLPTDAVGKLVLSTTWPPAVPSGVSLYAQAWITDAAGPAGFAATNGLQLTSP